MKWMYVEKLLANCTKQRVAGVHRPALVLPGDYGELFLHYDGVEGFVGREQYLLLWKAEQLEELNAAYQVAEFAPGIVLVGTDGGDTGFGLDEKTGRYVSVPLIGLSREATRDAGGSFEEFLARLAGAAGLHPVSR
jgi:hypothetical protein